jgi:hypothetical protein
MPDKSSKPVIKGTIKEEATTATDLENELGVRFLRRPRHGKHLPQPSRISFSARDPTNNDESGGIPDGAKQGNMHDSIKDNDST